MFLCFFILLTLIKAIWVCVILLVGCWILLITVSERNVCSGTFIKQHKESFSVFYFLGIVRNIYSVLERNVVNETTVLRLFGLVW